jgi:hypothetical protein
VCDAETPLLFHHSSRFYCWGALAGKRRRLSFDPELLYAGATSVVRWERRFAEEPNSSAWNGPATAQSTAAT